MKITKTNCSTNFEAKIKINKPQIESQIIKYAGATSVSGGSSTVATATSSGADMVVHGSESAVPYLQNSSGMFDQFSKSGHKILDTFFKNTQAHNGYDASFFSSVLSSLGSITYSQGMNNIIKGIEKNYKNKLPT